MSQSESYDLILMDMQMPIMDGEEATRHIRAAEKRSDRRTPIISPTASVMNEDRIRCKEAGMDYFVAKPISRNELFDAISKACPFRATIAH
jgi:CheY-like chemotaxis protein